MCLLLSFVMVRSSKFSVLIFSNLAVNCWFLCSLFVPVSNFLHRHIPVYLGLWCHQLICPNTWRSSKNSWVQKTTPDHFFEWRFITDYSFFLCYSRCRGVESMKGTWRIWSIDSVQATRSSKFYTWFSHLSENASLSVCL